MAPRKTYLARKLLFAPLCWSCGRPLFRDQDFCFACRKEIMRALAREGCLLRYEGAVTGLLACLRGSAPRLATEWCVALLERKGWLERWRQENFTSLALAPQNPRPEESGLELVGRSVGAALGRPLLMPFRKVGRRSQHGRALGERMDAPCFVALKEEVRGKILLLDDVCTTGTTLAQCAYLLRKGGAEVTCFSLARQMVPSFERKEEKAREEGEEMNPLLFHFLV